ncbi:MAG: DegQ family serine endoprotease [Desulfuromonadia bacterium]
MPIRIPLLLFLSFLLLSGCDRKKDALFYESRSTTAEAPVKDVSKDILATQQAFANVVKAVTPSVVNISTISRRPVARPFFEFSPFFGDLFEQTPRTRKETSLGSGFIINADGYIVTNDHVIKDAESIQVKLSTGDELYQAKVVGRDPKTDIAVLKISAKEPLKAAVLADSDSIQVGQWAIAIGNPFGLDRTVTVGVISATGRSGMGIETYENFIQTDASINPGNSGGPLLNIYGEVIGINTAIVAAGQGIGFAIPINMAKTIVSQLMRTGSVSRGWLGVSIQPVTPDIARSFGMKGTRGVLINDVSPGGPADRAGVKPGDVVTAYNGTEVKDPQHLQMLVAETPPGKGATLSVLRNGNTLSLTVTVGNQEAASSSGGKGRDRAETLGLVVEELPKQGRFASMRGVIVADLDPEGAAAAAGFEPGDIITAVNQKPVSSVAEFNRALEAASKRGAATFFVRRGSTSLFFALPLR